MMTDNESDEGVELMPKQMIFVESYLVHFNAAEAAREAGYAESSARAEGWRQLNKPEVQKIIQEKMDARLGRLEITGERVLHEIAKLAFSNMGDYISITPDGLASVDLSDLDPDKTAAISEMVVDTARIPGLEGVVEKVKFKLVDKGINLERLGRHLKLFTDQTETKNHTTYEVGESFSDLLGRINGESRSI